MVAIRESVISRPAPGAGALEHAVPVLFARRVGLTADSLTPTRDLKRDTFITVGE